MNTSLLVVPMLLAALSGAGSAQTLMGPSATLDLVREEEAKDPAAKPKSEQAKTDASEAYTGEGFQGVTIETLKPVGYVDLKKGDGDQEDVIQEKPLDSKKGNPSYHFEGKALLKGVNIYTAKEDKKGDEKTEKPEKAKGLVSPWLIYGALGLGLLALIAGIFFPPLLFVGGLGLGAGGVLWYINNKLGG